MIPALRRSSLRWRLVLWVVVTMLVVLAIVFVVVYEQTGSQLRSEINGDVRGDVTQLAETVKTISPGSAGRLADRLRDYIRAQTYPQRSSFLFAEVSGRTSVSNHPELLGRGRPDDSETEAQQERENRQGRDLLSGATGQRTVAVPDLGWVRVDEEIVTVGGIRVRVGAGESLGAVARAEHIVARSFLLAGALGALLVLFASYLAGVVVSRPLRRMARVATRINDGDLSPRMAVSPSAGSEIRVLTESFNRMLDRLSAAFEQQKAFVADASHELRTPLAVISGQLEVLAAEPDPSVDQIETTERLVRIEVMRTARLIDDMLLLTRSEQAGFLRRETIELASFVSELWMAARRGHEREFRFGPIAHGQIDADPDRLAQALRNLIDNAIAHTVAQDGLVSLRTELSADGWVRFTVSDDGPGIPPGEREKVFERFHRTDAARDRISGGTGLGLSIVRAIAEAHGGRTRATERPGGGAQLILELPVSPANGTPTAPAALPGRSGEHKH